MGEEVEGEDEGDEPKTVGEWNLLFFVFLGGSLVFLVARSAI